MNKPKVDIILATYNGECYLDELIESIVHQDYSNWHILACDDGSSDRTRSLLSRYESELKDKITVFNKKPSGAPQRNFLRLLKHSNADFAMFCDQDDVWDRSKVSTFISFYDKNCNPAKPSLIFSDLYVVDDNLRLVSSSFMKKSKLNPTRISLNRLLSLNCVAGCASMMNKLLVEKINETSSYEGVVMHDIWAALVAAAFGEISFIKRPTVLYRQHASNNVGAKIYAASVLKGVFGPQERKETLQKTMSQADAFLREYEDSLDFGSKRLVADYANLRFQGKTLRLTTCQKNRFWKYGIARKVDQFLNL